MVTPSLTAFEKAKEPWPPPLTPKVQFPDTRVLMVVETSSAVDGRTMHQGLKAALTDQYESRREAYSVWLGNRTLSPKPAAMSMPHYKKVSMVGWCLQKG